MSTRTTTPSLFSRVLVLAVAAAMLALPAAAFAAPAPVATYDVRTIIQQDGGRAMLAAVELAPEVKLPAEVSVNVPKGSKIDWAGEILGGDLAKDPTVQYTTKPGAEFDTLVFTLTKSRRGQVEMLFPQGATKSGDKTQATLAYVPAQAAARLSLSIEVPSDAKVGQIPADLKKQPSQSSSFYAKDFQNVKPGQKLQVALEYTGGTVPTPAQTAPAQGQPGAAVPQTGGSSATSPLIAVLALGAILAGTFAALTYMSKRGSAEPAEETDVPASSVRSDDDDDSFFDDGPVAPRAPTKATAAKKAASGTVTAEKKPSAKKTSAKSAGTAKPNAAKKATPKQAPAGGTTTRKSNTRSKKADGGSAAAREA